MTSASASRAGLADGHHSIDREPTTAARTLATAFRWIGQIEVCAAGGQYRLRVQAPRPETQTSIEATPQKSTPGVNAAHNPGHVRTLVFRCNLMIAYVCMMGLPLLGLLGILRAGRHLTSPISVAGTWMLEADFSAVPVEHCTQVLANALHGAVDISQSGDRLLLTFNDPRKTMIRGMIEQTTILTTAERRYSTGSADTNCDLERAIQLRASVNRQGGLDSLTGTVILNGCTTCPRVPLIGVRHTPEGRGGQ